MSPDLFQLIRTSLRGEKWMAPWTLPRWQAHRGYHRDGIPENSLASLRAAVQHGAQMCEFDVRLTRDQVPVLLHDEDLDRVTGRAGVLKNLTWKEVESYETVPTFEQVLMDPQGPPFFNVEIKSEEVWNEPLERRVAEVVRKTRTQNRILFSSFNPFSLWKLQTLLPEVPRALLVATDLKNRLLREMALAPFLKIQCLNLEDKMLPDQASVQAWREQGFLVNVWTVNEQSEIKKYQDWGVQSVITDLIPEK